MEGKAEEGGRVGAGGGGIAAGEGVAAAQRNLRFCHHQNFWVSLKCHQTFVFRYNVIMKVSSCYNAFSLLFNSFHNFSLL